MNLFQIPFPACQCSTKLVMNFTRYAFALLFSGGLNARGEGAQLVTCFFEFSFRLLKFGHVLGRAKYLDRLSHFIGHNRPSRTNHSFSAVESKDAMIIIVWLFTRDRALDDLP